MNPVRFALNERVTVVALGKPGHIRTPDYILGHCGEVIQFCGYFLNPEDLSVGRTSGPMVPLYRVKFRLSDLWAEPQHHAEDCLCIEIYDHWLAKEGSP
ncbi:MAG: SH3-like domain-containing protein [Burkholderiaceae bacterium]